MTLKVPVLVKNDTCNLVGSMCWLKSCSF